MSGRGSVVKLTSRLKRLLPARWRKSARKGMRTIVRKYAGASSSHLASGWIQAPAPIDQDVRLGLTALRARSREESQNNGYFKGFLRDLKENVVGAQGFQLISLPMDNDTVVDVEAKNTIERHWEIWSLKAMRPEMSGMGFKNFSKLVIQSAALDGEVFIWERRGSSLNPYRYSVRVLEVAVIDFQLNQDLKNGNVIRMGIELDEVRFPVAYHLIASDRDQDAFLNEQTGRRHLRVPNDEIIHLYLHDGVWQTRGVPWVHPALQRMNQTGKYEEAELIAARGGASKMGFITDADDGVGYTGDDTEDVADDDYLYEEFEPGVIGRLKKGQEFTSFDPDHPNSGYKDFIKTQLRGIAAALGESYNAYAQDLEGVSFGSLRQGALSERAVWMGLQEWLIDEAFDRIFTSWLEQGLLSGAIKNRNGVSLPISRLDKFLEHEWQPRRWEWIDPLKDTTADRFQQQDLTMSRSERIRKRGRQPDKVFQEIAAENKAMELLGIAPTQVDATLGDASADDRITALEIAISDIADGAQQDA